MLHTYFDWIASQRSRFDQQVQSELKQLSIITAFFFSFVLCLSLHRYYTFYVSYDHGLFNQIFLNNLHGRFFQSSLSGANSFGALAEGKVPLISAVHLGQHFVPDFLLWLPFYALFPDPVTLVVLQTSLMTAGGVVLYWLARHYLQPNLSLFITASYYSASAVLGPTLANFYEQCQIPLLTFGCLLAMEKQRWWLFWLLALLVLGIREDTGLILFSIGLYLLVSRRQPLIGGLLCVLSFGYVTAITTFVMPHFSADSSKLYLASRFKDFVEGNSDPSTLQVLLGLLTHPINLFTKLFSPFDTRIFYLFKQWLPLAFVSAISGASWILTGVPLLSLMTQSGPIALTISIRYSISVVPGLFYGAIIWWSYHANQFKPSFRRFWIGCLSLSLVIVLADNPNRTFYFLQPDPFLAQFSVPIARQWEHSRHVWNIVHAIPPQATVSTSTYMIPALSNRRGVLRVPFMKLQEDNGQIATVDYVAADVWQLLRPQGLPKFDVSHLQSALELCDRVIADSSYGIRAVEDGVVLLQKGVRSDPTALTAWRNFRPQLLSPPGNSLLNDRNKRVEEN